jgi:hypothetical protein
MPVVSSSKLPPWRCSHAKKLLIKDILDGKVIEGMAPKNVFVMRPEYQLYKYENFVTNLRNLRKQIAEKQDLADDNEAAFAHDEVFGLRVNSKPYPRWQGSVAERLLKQDIDNGQHLHMKPHELKESRVEYGPYYPGTIFRDHIHQELRARMERPYWLARRKEKEEVRCNKKTKKKN